MGDLETIKLTEEQKKAQKSRNRAIAWMLGGLVVLFYALTLVKFNPAVIFNYVNDPTKTETSESAQ